jgi:hypothetical protein
VMQAIVPHAPFFEVLVLYSNILDLLDFFGHLRVEDSVVGLLLRLVQNVENACPQQALVYTNLYLSIYMYINVHTYIHNRYIYILDIDK